jgi:hypothetical protein
MPDSIPTIALTTPDDAKGFLEAYPSAPEGPERAVWEDRLIEALALEWFRIRQGLIEEKGAEFASQAYQINLRSGTGESLGFAGFMTKGSSTYSASAEKKNKGFMSALSDQIKAVPLVSEGLWILRQRHGGRVDVDLRSQQATWSSLVTPEHEARNRAAKLDQALGSAPTRLPGPRL